jgi:hypothetical protein
MLPRPESVATAYNGLLRKYKYFCRFLKRKRKPFE